MLFGVETPSPSPQTFHIVQSYLPNGFFFKLRLAVVLIFSIQSVVSYNFQNAGVLILHLILNNKGFRVVLHFIWSSMELVFLQGSRVARHVHF